MKKKAGSIVIFLLLVFSLPAIGQKEKLIGTWITPAQEFLQVWDTTNYFDNSSTLGNGEEDEGMTLIRMGDTLSFQKRYYSSATDYKVLYVDRYDLLIIRSNDTEIVVKPVSELSSRFFKNKSSIKFVRQEYTADTSIHFDKIIYHATNNCFGTCVDIHLEIDKQKHMDINGFFTTQGIDTYGPREGMLTDSLYKELVHLLQTCNLRTLYFPKRIGFDGTVSTLIIYHDGQRKFFKSMFPPKIAERLISYLYWLKDNVNLCPALTTCDIEDIPDPPPPPRTKRKTRD